MTSTKDDISKELLIDTLLRSGGKLSTETMRWIENDYDNYINESLSAAFRNASIAGNLPTIKWLFDDRSKDVFIGNDCPLCLHLESNNPTRMEFIEFFAEEKGFLTQCKKCLWTITTKIDNEVERNVLVKKIMACVNK